jgi:hypothetical protein
MDNAALRKFLKESGAKRITEALSVSIPKELEGLSRTDIVKLMSSVMSEDSKRMSILNNFNFDAVSFIYSRSRAFFSNVSHYVNADIKNDV